MQIWRTMIEEKNKFAGLPLVKYFTKPMIFCFFFQSTINKLNKKNTLRIFFI